MKRYPSPENNGQHWSVLLRLSVILVFSLVFGFFALLYTHSTVNGKDVTSVPTKPAGTTTTQPLSNGNWIVAQGLPRSSVTRFTFSSKTPSVGYASILNSKQTQDIYKTADAGTTCSVLASASDIFSVNPLDSNDAVLATVYVPIPGTYTIQRTYDGGRNWTPQTIAMTTAATATVNGWVDDTFLLTFQVQGQSVSNSTVVAFAAKKEAVHIDNNGSINGVKLQQIYVVAGRKNRIQIWGTTDATKNTVVGLVTFDFGKNWKELPTTVSNVALQPIAATDDGTTLVSITLDKKQLALSTDEGTSWVTQPAHSSEGIWMEKGIFVTADSQIFAAYSDGFYQLKQGAWSKVSKRDIVAASTNSTTHETRIWTYDENEQVVWQKI